MRLAFNPLLNQWRAYVLRPKGALVAIALLMIYAGMSDLLAKPEKIALQWGQACDEMMCSPAAMLVGQVPDAASSVIDALQARPQVATLCLQSQGGSSDGALDLAGWLVRHGYNTCVPRVPNGRAVCSGACAVVFAGGQQRQVDKEVAFGIHDRAVAGLIRQPPDALTGKPGIPAGDSPWQRELSIKANQMASRITQIMQFSSMPKPMEKLSREAALVPAHTLRLLVPGEMEEWRLVSRPANKELMWLPEQDHVAFANGEKPLSKESAQP